MQAAKAHTLFCRQREMMHFGREGGKRQKFIVQANAWKLRWKFQVN